MSRWVVKIILASGVLRLFTNLFRPEYTRPLLDVVTDLTSNKDLQTMFMYCWGDFGCPPSKTTFVMQVKETLNMSGIRKSCFYSESDYKLFHAIFHNIPLNSCNNRRH